MWSTLNFLCLGMLATNRWFVYKTNKTQDYHTILGITFIVIIISMVISQMTLVGFQLTYTIHTFQGFLVAFFIFYVVYAGLVNLKTKQQTVWNTTRVKHIKKFHKTAGIILLAMVQFNIFFGI